MSRLNLYKVGEFSDLEIIVSDNIANLLGKDTGIHDTVYDAQGYELAEALIHRLPAKTVFALFHRLEDWINGDN